MTFEEEDENRINDIAPLIFILEDLHKFDELSWSFTKKVLEIKSNILIIGIVRDDANINQDLK